MKIYSEKLNKFYDTIEACTEAEKKHDDAKKIEEEKKAALTAARAERAKKVEGLYKAYLEAQKKYHEALRDFCKDYGSFHMSYSSDDILPDLFDLFF